MRWWLLLFLAACAKDLSDLQPFPCPADQTCPSGLACTAGVCGVPQLDSDCAHGQVDCTVAEPGAGCWKGHQCEPSCSSDAAVSCGGGRVCVDDACLIDSSTSDACPSDLACHIVGTGPAKACMAPSIYVPACQSFTPRATTECFPNCGSTLFDIPCSTGGKCTEHSICDMPGHCMCGAGYTGVTCAGVNCDTTPCNFPDWYCVWATPPSTCATTAPGPGTCTCRNGVTIDRGCTSTACEQLCEDLQSM